MPAAPHRSPSRWRTFAWFWGSLLLALACVLLAYRPVVPPPGWCVDQLTDTKTNAPLSLPLYVTAADRGEGTLELTHRFVVDTQWAGRPALYLGKAAPFYRLRLNARDLTPGVDFGRRDRRDLEPHLHALPIDALVAGTNVLTFQFPVSATLGGTRVDMICVGDYDTLLAAQRGNWWRHVGMSYLCLALFAILALIALALRRLNPGAQFYFWYIACLLLLPSRIAYMVMGTMPGGPALWGALTDLTLPLMILPMYRLMASFWGITPKHWVSGWVIGASILQLCAAAMGWDLEYSSLKMVFRLLIIGLLAVVVLQIGLRIRHVPAIERLSMQWAVLFTIVCAAIEVLTFRMGSAGRLTGMYPLAMALLALMFGFLLMRRALLGTALLSRATQTLSHDLDRALSPAPEQGKTIWNELSSNIAGSERQRMLHDINDGFGSRMQDVLQRIRNEHPDSRLDVDIQRALLDLRLMVDAMDESFTSVGGALATLQQRMQGPLATAGIHSVWDIAEIGDLQVNNRRELMELFRCLEELLSNVIQHAQATQVSIRGRSDGARILLHVEDDGRGLASDRRNGRGLQNVESRMRKLRGEVTFCSDEHCGTRVELTLPRI